MTADPLSSDRGSEWMNPETADADIQSSSSNNTTTQETSSSAEAKAPAAKAPAAKVEDVASAFDDLFNN